MPLVLTEEQAMLRDSARNFLAEQAPVTQLRRLRDSADALGYSRELWQQFASMGYCGMLVPEALGGLGLGQVEAGVVMEQIGHQLCASPLLASCIVATTLLRQGGSAAQQQLWLPQLARADAIATLALDEGAKHGRTPIATLAHAQGDGWVLDGAKALVLDGHVADLLIVAAQAGDAGSDLGLFLVPKGSAGVEVERSVMLDAHNAARVLLRNVQLPGSAALGVPGSAQVASALRCALDAGRLGASAELLGLADEVFERTVQYLKDRRQFGKSIGEFQALQHRAATLYCELELTRTVVLQAQQALDRDSAGAGAQVALAKARAGRCAVLAVQEALQMHGGMGMTDACEIGFFMKRARVLQELWGDANFHLDAYALGRGY